MHKLLKVVQTHAKVVKGYAHYYFVDRNWFVQEGHHASLLAPVLMELAVVRSRCHHLHVS